MIVRIMGEGQLQLDEDHLPELNTLDDALADAVATDDEPRFAEQLAVLIARVRSLGSPLPEADLAASDVILPGPSSSLAEVRALLGEEGLIPG